MDGHKGTLEADFVGVRRLCWPTQRRHGAIRSWCDHGRLPAEVSEVLETRARRPPRSLLDDPEWLAELVSHGVFDHDAQQW